MDNAQLDDNFVPTLQGVSSTDGESPASIKVNPDIDGSGTHGVIVEVVDG